jgi:hypothetical protein
MTSIPSSPLPVVLSLDAATAETHCSISINSDEVFTIPMTLAADGEHGLLSWDELIGKR